MFVVQNESHPGEMQNALYDLMREGLQEVRVCAAYVTLSGSEILLDSIARSAGNVGDANAIAKTIVTSFDFGLTDPDALQLWLDMPRCHVQVAGSAELDRGSLTPHAAFHPKLYLVNRPGGLVGSLVGSANLTNRGLTINTEVGWLEREHQNQAAVDDAWQAAISSTVPLTAEILDRYREAHRRVPRDRITGELEPVPDPKVGRPGDYPPFGDADIDPSAYGQIWIQAIRLSGGSRTQLELPRGAHRFFGADFRGYDYERVDHIAEPILVSGRTSWDDRPLTWHGDNQMERINLPSRARGGFDYENSLILFRRIAANTFELRVYPWDSDSARAFVEASRRARLIYRVGRSPRLAGLVP